MRAADGQGAEPIVAGLCRTLRGTRCPRAARSRSARAAHRARPRRPGGARHDPGAARRAPPDRGVHDPGQRRRRRGAGGPQGACRLPGARATVAGEARRAARFPVVAEPHHAGRRPAPPAPLQRGAGAGEGDAGRRPRQRGRAAVAVAGRLPAGERRPFRSQSGTLRSLHLADPPLCRSRRSPLADPRARTRRRRARAVRRRPSSRTLRNAYRRPSAARWPPSAKPSTG